MIQLQKYDTDMCGWQDCCSGEFSQLSKLLTGIEALNGKQPELGSLTPAAADQRCSVRTSRNERSKVSFETPSDFEMRVSCLLPTSLAPMLLETSNSYRRVRGRLARRKRRPSRVSQLAACARSRKETSAASILAAHWLRPVFGRPTRSAAPILIDDAFTCPDCAQRLDWQECRADAKDIHLDRFRVLPKRIKQEQQAQYDRLSQSMS